MGCSRSRRSAPWAAARRPGSRGSRRRSAAAAAEAAAAGRAPGACAAAEPCSAWRTCSWRSDAESGARWTPSRSWCWTHRGAQPPTRSREEATTRFASAKQLRPPSLKQHQRGAPVLRVTHRRRLNALSPNTRFCANEPNTFPLDKADNTSRTRVLLRQIRVGPDRRCCRLGGLPPGVCFQHAASSAPLGEKQGRTLR